MMCLELAGASPRPDGSGAPSLHRGWVCVLGLTSIVCNSFLKAGKEPFLFFSF